MRNAESASVLYACNGAHHRDRTYLYGVHTHFPTQREREREREREICRICPELVFSFLKGMTGALAPFSYLVIKY